MATQSPVPGATPDNNPASKWHCNSEPIRKYASQRRTQASMIFWLSAATMLAGLVVIWKGGVDATTHDTTVILIGFALELLGILALAMYRSVLKHDQNVICILERRADIELALDIMESIGPDTWKIGQEITTKIDIIRFIMLGAQNEVSPDAQIQTTS